MGDRKLTIGGFVISKLSKSIYEIHKVVVQIIQGGEYMMS